MLWQGIQEARVDGSLYQSEERKMLEKLGGWSSLGIESWMEGGRKSENEEDV